jgi:lipoic acid synthetase
MVGLGERVEEVHTLLRDLVRANVDVGTIGQYLQPTRRNRKVAEFVTPAQFDAYRDFGLTAGLKTVFSGPLVRSG